MKIRKYQAKDRAELVQLWTLCKLINPKNDPEKDINRKLKSESGWIYVGVVDGTLVASAMVGYEGHRGWINYLAVLPAFQNRGYGRQIMDKAEQELRKAGCPKINLQIRRGNKSVVKFYERLGFSEDTVISMGKRLVDDSIPKQGKTSRITKRSS
jgi:ribosomal protein S18 acetylase RimI-like enzyme